MKALGVILILVGVLAFVYQGYTYRTREKVLDIGSIEATVERDKRVDIPPIVGGVAVLAGIVLVFAGGRRRLA